ncbi:MAG: ECF transporter S component [Promethearchaeota archaeon]
MNKSKLILAVILLYSLFLLIFPDFISWKMLVPSNSILGILINVSIFFLLSILGLYFHLRETELTSKEITFIAIYSAFTAIARIPFVALPNVQPCSYLIFVAGMVFGPVIGFMIGTNTAFLSNMFLGHGPWTVYQIIAWGLIGIIGGLFHPLRRKLHKGKYQFLVAITGFLLGFVYGAIMNIWSWLLVTPLSLSSFLVLYISSFPFDLAHAVSNFLFLYYFGEKTVNILNRYRDRFYVRIDTKNIHEEISPKIAISENIR